MSKENQRIDHKLKLNEPLHTGADAIAIDKAPSLPEAMLNDNTKLAQELLAAGADANVMIYPKDSLTALHLAAKRGDAQLLQALLNAGANIAAQDINGQTPLHLAADTGYTESVLILLTANADASAQDKNGKSPLHLALVNDNIQSVDALLAAGANIDAQDINGQTPLESLVKYHIKCSKYYTKQNGCCDYSDSCIEQVEKKFIALLEKMLENQDQAPNQYSSLMNFLLTQDLIPKDFICTLANHMEKEGIKGGIMHARHITLKLQNLIQCTQHTKMALENSSYKNQNEITAELKNIQTLENTLNKWKQPVYSAPIKIHTSLWTKWANDSLFRTINYNKNVTNDVHNMDLIGINDTPFPVELDVD